MKYYPTLIGIVAIWLALLACRPVFAIGWTELIILVIIIIFLLGPYLLRLYRTYDKIKKASQNEEKGNKQ
jgi:hypothetical protein